MPTAIASDAMLDRLENELREKKAFTNEIMQRAQNAGRDLTSDDQQLLAEARDRMVTIKDQIDTIESVSQVSHAAVQRARDVGEQLTTMRETTQGRIEYRSAGEYLSDMWQSTVQKKPRATERIAAYHEQLQVQERAADHDRTGDVPGLIPNPIVGEVLNFIDAARPLTQFLGPRPMPGATWRRPIVSQHTAVGAQGAAGAAADEKAELTSQKFIVTALDGSAKTYGGYVNLSRQFIDFTVPSGLDAVTNDLSANYAIETEAALGAALHAVSTTAIGYGATPDGASVGKAFWRAVAQVYKAVRGQGRLFAVVGTDVLEVFAPLFAPYGPLNQFGTGFDASKFGQGVMGQIAGVPVIMSAGLTPTDSFVGSTAAVEVYEQRIGTLQVTEPSVLGMQLAYAGYYDVMMIKADGIVPLTAT